MNQSNWKDNFHMWQCVRLYMYMRLMFLLCINSLKHTHARARVQTNVYIQREVDSGRPADRQTLLFSKCNIVGNAHDYSIGKCHIYKTRMKKNKYWSRNCFGSELAAEFMARKNHLLCNTFFRKCVQMCEW